MQLAHLPSPIFEPAELKKNDFRRLMKGVAKSLKRASGEGADLVNPKDFLVHDDGYTPVAGTLSTLKRLLHNAYILFYIKFE